MNAQAQTRQQIFAVVRQIPAGKVATYGQIAFLAGIPNAPRRVGQVLHHAPDAPGLPCHRVVNSAGRLVPGWIDQRMLLEKEGVGFKANGCVDLARFLWYPAN